MIQHLLVLLPLQLSSMALLFALTGAALGVILWLAGSRFNRTIVTLISVSGGALIGLQMPGWFGWGLEGWATAVLAAIALGITGYVLPKVWVGVGLGTMLAIWVGAATLGNCGDATFAWPGAEANWREQVGQIWNGLPGDARRLLPFACATALFSGFSLALLWPRLGTALLYSGAGISLLLGLGLPVLNAVRRDWLRAIPGRTSSQIVVLFSLVAFGAIVQWRCVPGARVRPPVEG